MKGAFEFLKPESDRFLHSDVLRFIASAGVVIYHYRDQITWSPDNLYINNYFSGFHLFVDLFFVLSGVVICSLYGARMNTLAEYGRFLWCRVARLVPLHYATLLAFCILGAAFDTLSIQVSHPENYDWGCLIPNLLMLHAFGTCHSLTFNFPSWSISAEMGMYVAFPLFLALTRRPALAWIALIAIVFGLSVADDFANRRWLHWTFDFGVLRAVPAFLLGIVLTRQQAILLKVPYPSTWMWASLVGFVLEGIIAAPEELQLATVYLVGVFGFAADVQGKGKASRFVWAMAPLGRLTYSLYMLHIIVITVAMAFLRKIVHLPPGALNVVVILIGVLLLPAISIVSLFLFETPMRRWLSGRRPPRQVSGPSLEREFAP